MPASNTANMQKSLKNALATALFSAPLSLVVFFLLCNLEGTQLG